MISLHAEDLHKLTNLKKISHITVRHLIQNMSKLIV